MTILESLENELAKASKLLADFSQTRSFFRSGTEHTVTIGNKVDIEKQQDKVNSIKQQIENIINPPPEPTPEPVIIVRPDARETTSNAVSTPAIQDSIAETSNSILGGITEKIKGLVKNPTPIFLIGGVTVAGYLVVSASKKRRT